MRNIVTVLVFFMTLYACEDAKLFELVDAKDSGVHFRNDLEHTTEFNMYTYRNFYNGGGVGVGDINQDGLEDLFFCGNLVDNKLYLNLGGLKFEDITEKAGVASENVWSTGVSFVDINGDGWLDIYVCKSGRPGGEKRHNELFINEGDLTFTERARSYGLDDLGLSTHAAFLDYDKDGDLDCYLLNNSFRPVGGYDMRPDLRYIRDSLGGNKFYKNMNIEGRDTFIDVSAEAGVYGSAIGFGLGVAVSDVNRDGWPDLYVSNDFFERDYLYINQHNGTFLENLPDQMPEISMGSMGADVADINNDAYPEVFVTEMLPRDDDRYKTKMTFENWDKYVRNIQNGYHQQFTRNTLQLNNRNGTFSEIGRLANVDATDWSWSALVGDYDNDGWKDIFVSNGIVKDLLDQDYINFHSTSPEITKALRQKEEGAINKLIDLIPSEGISNFIFQNNRDLTFSDVSTQWGIDVPGFSNGSAIADLDNDGDLEIVVNNCNMASSLLRNNSENSNYIQVDLRMQGSNSYALGSQVTVHTGNELYYQELAPHRGFQSSSSYVLHFGLGDLKDVDSILVCWPDLSCTKYDDLKINTRHVLTKSVHDPDYPLRTSTAKSPIMTKEVVPGLTWMHKESDFVDFDRDRLLPQMYSAWGPAAAVGDIDGDGDDDLFLGGSSGQPSVILIQQSDGSFEALRQTSFEQYSLGEDVAAVFFDADGDSDLDLYVACGSNEFLGLSYESIDRLYTNDGNGVFSIGKRLPTSIQGFSSSIAISDVDHDGDTDLVVGTLMKPGVYGVPVNSVLLVNDGAGLFADRTQEQASGLHELGMVTDVAFADLEGDGDPDLIAVGHWMSPKVLINEDGILELKEIANTTSGLWNCVEAVDLNGDGLVELLLGNHGLNSRLRATEASPMNMLTNDFDDNRSPEQVIARKRNGSWYPIALRHDLVTQMPNLKKRYLYHEDYKGQRVRDMFDQDKLRTSAMAQLNGMQSGTLWNQGGLSFKFEPWPMMSQLAPVRSIQVIGVSTVSKKLIVLGGNELRSKPELGVYAGSYGTCMMVGEERNLQVLPNYDAGLLVRGQVSSILSITILNRQHLLFAINDGQVVTYRYDSVDAQSTL